MATNLGKAYVQIMPSAKGISGMISKELDGEVKSAGQSAGNSLISTIKNAILAAGIGKLFATSLFEGGKLQQSLGGVETLFKNNAETVKQYANEAYRTTGLSANAYMENVTGFSASLLQSLGGDTAKAAKIANMAMVDMADNSNKMGTSMEMIQNAYQGFAKQNYTMLDNLKLGYGGTKKEMERLLADAQKLTGVKYDINNLADVYEAIHVIQKELDITGTTAKEASTTLQGSFNAMKASFLNLLGNLSLGQEIRPSLYALAKTTSTFLVGNFLPMVGNILKGLPTLIIGAFSGLTEQLEGILGEEVVSKIIGFLDQVSVAVESFIEVLTGTMSKQEGVDLMEALGIKEETATTIVNIADNIREAFKNIWQAIKNVGSIVGEFIGDLLGINETESSVSLLRSAFEFVSKIVKEVSEWIKKFTGFLRESTVASSLVKTALAGLLAGFIALKIIGTIKSLFTGLVIALNAAKGAVVAFNLALATNPITAIIVGITALVTALVWFFTKTETGKQIWQGFVNFLKQAWQGVSEFFSTLWTNINTVIFTVWTGIVTFFGGIWESIITTITTVWTGIVTFFGGIWESITTAIVTAWNGIKEFFVGLWEGIKLIVETVWTGIVTFFVTIWESITTTITTVWNGIKEFFSTLWDSIKTKVEEIWNGVKEFLSGLWESIKTIAITAWETLKGTVVGIINGLVEGAKRAWEILKTSVSEAVGKVKEFFGKLSEINLFEAGAAIIRGFLNGLKSVYEKVKSFVSGIANWIRDHKGPIEYDRKLLIPAGNAIMGGLHESLKDKFKTVQQTVKGMAGAINKGFTNEITDFEFNNAISKDLTVAAKSKFDFDFGEDKNDDVVNALGIVQDLLEKIYNKDTDTYLDGVKLAKNSYDKQMMFIRREGI
jgi:phage-related protein